MNSKRSKIVLAAALAAAAVLLFGPFGGALRTISAFCALWYLPGLLFLLAAGNPERPALDILFGPLLISPVLVSVALVLLSLAGIDLRSSARLCAISAIAIAFGTLLRPGSPRAAHRPFTRLVLTVSCGFAALVATAYIANRFLIVRSDAWYHGCVVSDILARGIPPMEPGFPDVPIRYMWIYHAFNAAWMDLSGLAVFPALAVFNVVNAFAFPYLVARLAAVFFPERRYILAAAVLAIIGLDSATWILWPLNLVRALVGEVTGMAEIARIMNALELDGSGVIGSLRIQWTWMVSTPDKHLTITAFSYALNLFILAFLAARDARFGAAAPVRRFLSLLVAILGALSFHVIMGAALLTSAVGAAVIALAARAVTRRALLLRREIAALLGTSALAIAICLPYLRSLVGGTRSEAGLGSYFHFGLRNMLTIALPLAVLYPASQRALRALASSALETRMLLLWLASLGALNAVANLPTVNESKLVFPVFALITPFVARELVAWFERVRGIRKTLFGAWLAALFIAPFTLTIRGFLLDQPQVDCERRQYEVAPAERELYAWITAHAPERAAIIERATCDVMPIHAGRRSLVPDLETITVDGYAGPKVDLYVRIHADLFSGAADLDADLAALAGTENDYYLVLWRRDRAVDANLERQIAERPETFIKAFENIAGAVYTVGTIERREGAVPR